MPSTAIRAHAYDDRTRQLTITFVSGRRYVYDEVPKAVYTAFTRADSLGGFFNSKIRDHYRYREIEADD